ncbi:hypothetical protein FOL47_004303 [Perkinsus chesapeaki]|uniref:Uncharacterized protein n=1 Tax=Perkinsus chesapeaki TaxID=330153 RepID=A0A7J6M391_PERCH|nr:hypothetical protein FOL47_004303 [Perkinsus chesapeaki]
MPTKGKEPMSKEKQMLTLMLQEHHSNSVGNKREVESGESSEDILHVAEGSSESGMEDNVVLLLGEGSVTASLTVHEARAYPPGLGYSSCPREEPVVDESDDEGSSVLQWTGNVLELDPTHPKCTVDGNTIREHVIQQKDGPFQAAFPLAGVKRSGTIRQCVVLVLDKVPFPDDTLEEVRRQMRAVDLDANSTRKPHRFEVLSNSRRVYDLEACEGIDGSSYVVCTDGMFDIAVNRFSPCRSARPDSLIAGCELYIHLEGEERSEICEVHWCPLTPLEKAAESDGDAHDDEDCIDHVFFTVHSDGSLCFWSLRRMRALVAAGSHPAVSNCPQGFARVSIEVDKCDDVCVQVYHQVGEVYKEEASADGNSSEVHCAEGKVTASLSTDGKARVAGVADISHPMHGTRLVTACGAHVRYFTVNPSSWEIHFVAEHDISTGEHARGVKSAIIGCSETIIIILEKALIIALQFKGEIQIGQIVRLTASSPVSFTGSIDALTIEPPAADTSSVDTEEATVEAPSETLSIALLTDPSATKSYWMLLSAGCVTFHEVEGFGVASGFVSHSNPDPTVHTVVTWAVGDPGQTKYQYLYSNGVVLELGQLSIMLEAAKSAVPKPVEQKEAVVPVSAAAKGAMEKVKAETSGMTASELLKRMLQIKSDRKAATESDDGKDRKDIKEAALEVSGTPLAGEISSNEDLEESDAQGSSQAAEQADRPDENPRTREQPSPRSSADRGVAQRRGSLSKSVTDNSLSPRRKSGDRSDSQRQADFVPTDEPVNAHQMRKFIRFLADATIVTAERESEPVEGGGASLCAEVDKLNHCLEVAMTPEALTTHMMHSDKVWRGVRRLSNSSERASTEVSAEVAKVLPGMVKELFKEKAVPAVVEAMNQKMTEINTFEQPGSSSDALDGLSDGIQKVDEEVRNLGTRVADMESILRRTEQQASEALNSQQESLLGMMDLVDRMKMPSGVDGGGSGRPALNGSSVAAAVSVGLQGDIRELNSLAGQLRAEIDAYRRRAGTSMSAPEASSYLQPDPRPDWQRVKEYLRSQQYHWAVATALELRENATTAAGAMAPPALLCDDLVAFACFEVDKFANIDSFMRSVAGVDSPSRTWPQGKSDRLNLAFVQMLRLGDYLVWASGTFNAPEDLRYLESVVRVMGLDAEAVEELCAAGAAERPDMVKQSLSRVIGRLRAVKCQSSRIRLAVAELRSHLLSIQNEGVFACPRVSAASSSRHTPESARSPLMNDDLSAIRTSMDDPTNSGDILIALNHDFIKLHVIVTEFREAILSLQFPLEGTKYPEAPAIVDVSSAHLSTVACDKLRQMVDKIAQQKAKKSEDHILPCIQLFRDVMRKSLLLPCMEELDLIKKDFLNEDDTIKLLDSKGKIHLTVNERSMHVKFDIKVPPEYPYEPAVVTMVQSTFAPHLNEMFFGQAQDLSRRCTKGQTLSTSLRASDPAKPSQSVVKLSLAQYKHDVAFLKERKDKAAHVTNKVGRRAVRYFEKTEWAAELEREQKQAALEKALYQHKQPPPILSVYPVTEFLVTKFIRLVPNMKCSSCGKRVLANIVSDDPAAPSEDTAERAYCGHWFHGSCLNTLMTTPPFGMSCPDKDCGWRIYHNKYTRDQKFLEKQWAMAEARKRELEDVMDFARDIERL